MAKEVGRPTVMTPEVIGKLEEAFAIDATVLEACFYADIHPDTYYQFLKDKPQYSDRFKALRQRPVLKARQTIAKSLDDPKNAQWYLERKKKVEFAQRTEFTGEGGEALKIIFDPTFNDKQPTITR